MRQKTRQAKTIRKHDRLGSEDRIKNAAVEVFAQKGYAATTVRMVASKAKLNVSLISRYFGGKEQLFKIVLQEEVGKLVSAGLEYPAQPTLEQELTAYFHFIFRHFEKNICFLRIAAVQAILDKRFAKVVEKSTLLPKDLRLQVRLQKLQRSGKIAKNIDIEVLHMSLATFVSGQLLNWMLIFRKPLNEIEKSARDFASILNDWCRG